jgi:hypothetical protein
MSARLEEGHRWRIWGGGGRDLRGNRRWWRRLRTSRLDSLHRKSKEEVAELPSLSVEAGVARNGAASRRPCRTCLATGRKTRKKKGGQGKEEEGGRFFVTSRGSRTSPRWPGHKQEVAKAGTGSLHAAAQGRTQRGRFAKSPLALGFFLGS